MTRDERPYYYRLRGVVLGPFSVEQMRQKAATAQLGSRTEVSRDSVTWGRGADFSEIFDRQPVRQEPRWYYAVDGTQQGPVDLDVLRGHVAGRVLAADDYVLREGGDQWVAVSAVPELAVCVPQRPPMADTPPPHPQPTVVTIVPSDPPPTNGMAVAGFVCSLLGFVTVITWPVGLVLSVVALNSANRANRGLAVAGAIIGAVFTSFLILCIVAIVVIVTNGTRLF
jgi:hypothetical protein